MRFLLPLFLSGAALVPAFGQGRPSPAANGFFHVRQVDQQWELVDPRGRPFLSMGVDAARHHQDEGKDSHRCFYEEAVLAKYGSVKAWREEIAQKLLGLGFNTLGAWSDDEIATVGVDNEHLAYARILDLGASYVLSKTQGQGAVG